VEIPMTAELSSKHRPDEVCEVLGIKQSAYYNRLNFLNIEQSKDESGAYLTSDQMQTMEELNQHIRETGKMKGFRQGGELAVAENSDLGLVLEIPVAEFEVDSDGALEGLMREAAELKVQQAAMPDLVKLHLAANMSEDDLPDDLKQKLAAVREAANPKKQNPGAIAQQLLQQYRQNQNQNQNG
jgi:hypothetical protein